MSSPKETKETPTPLDVQINQSLKPFAEILDSDQSNWHTTIQVTPHLPQDKFKTFEQALAETGSVQYSLSVSIRLPDVYLFMSVIDTEHGEELVLTHNDQSYQVPRSTISYGVSYDKRYNHTHSLNLHIGDIANDPTFDRGLAWIHPTGSDPDKYPTRLTFNIIPGADLSNLVNEIDRLSKQATTILSQITSR